MSSFLTIYLPWLLFFGTAVYGHVAMKLAVTSAGGEEKFSMIASLTNVWGLTGCLAWGLSSLIWIWVLSKHSLMSASSISSLRYVGICLAAVLFLNEGMGKNHILGVLLIAMGIYFVTRSA